MNAAFCSYRVLEQTEMRVSSLVLTAILLSSAPVAGQEPSIPNAASTCTYDACALRLEQRRLLRGAERRPVLSLGTWGAPSLRPHVRRPIPPSPTPPNSIVTTRWVRAWASLGSWGRR